ncbi:LysR family transcriptional regulator [Ruegeria sp.]|uniref:LysR family transcriptional regulator n=1 Tax=Ruegeria sp. TaxID=1879320 RepID=UPI00231AF497|nr:LysR family transcriptional regulator [Ruegeria sp.]MDA7963583.1 LysR family transcriptional regulator [Ruegeria sp.]
MNIIAVQTFLAVVECGNLNKAADRLNVTQSTVSARLDALDAALGQPLLVRSRRGAQLTRAGFAFRAHAETIVRSWDQARSAVGLPTGFSALFSFACEVDLWPSAGRLWFDAARRAHPEIAFEAWPASQDEIKAWLASGLTDAALTTEPFAGPDLTSTELIVERLIQVSSCPRTAQDWHPDYIYVDHGAKFRRQHSETWSNEQTASVAYACGAWALDHLLTEGGSAYLPWPVCKPHLESGRLHRVDGSPEFTRAIYRIVRTSSQTAFPWVCDMKP